jgi:hypothetical protein
LSPYASQNEQGVARAGGSEFSFELATDEPVWKEDGDEDSMDTAELIRKLPKRVRWINEKPIECNPFLSPTKKITFVSYTDASHRDGSGGEQKD